MIKLETENLIIRDHAEEDLVSLHELLTDNDVMKYLDFKSVTIEDTKNNLQISMDESDKNENRKKHYFAIINKKTGDHIGEIGFTVIKKNDTGGICNLGYFINKKLWGYGYTTEEFIKFKFFFIKD